MVVAQAGTRGQYVTLQHDSFWLQNLVIMATGTCCTSRQAETHKPHLSGIQNNLRITTTRKSRLPGYFLKFEKFPDRQKHIKPQLSGIQNNQRITTTRKSHLPGYFLKFEKFPDRQKHIKPHLSGIQINQRSTMTTKTCLPGYNFPNW
jgi:hypothetical protein